MSGYDHEPRRSTRREYREERYEERDPRYFEASDSHLRPHPSRELVPRSREDSDLSVEEIRREFPPPTGNYRDRRARSADPGYDDYDNRRSYYSRDPRDRDYDRGYDRGYDRDHDRDYDRDYDRRSRKEESLYYEEEKEKRRRTISKQEKIIAAIGGFALAVGGKELYDRHEAKQEGEAEVVRNPLASAALGAAGALAAYQGAELYNKHAEKEEKKSSLVVHKGRDGQMVRYEEEEMHPKEKKGSKNFLESALAAAGLGGAVKALTGKSDDDKDKEKDKDRDGKSDTRSRRGSRSRSRSKSPEKKNKVQQAAMASLIAGATEAFRVAKEPGGWKGEKAKRIFTAAAGAATIDAAQNPDKNQKLSLAESVIGGLVGNRVIHGSKKNIEEDKATGRSRSRSRHARDSSAKGDGGGSGGVSGLAALATAGLGAIGAKKLIDSRKDKDEDDGGRSRSRARSRSRSRSGSRSPERKRSRSRSVVDGARRRLARLGIGNGPADDDKEKDAKDNRSVVASPRDSSRHRRRRYSDEYDDYHDRRRSRSRSRVGDRRRRGDSGSDTDLGDSDNDRRETTRKRGKQALTIGLAGVATIHAAHNVYLSMEKHNKRQKAVKEGRLSEEEAKKLKTKAILQDAAAVGIAALGIKGAISEVKEAREKSKEFGEWKLEKEARRQRRLARQRAVLEREAAKEKHRRELEDGGYRTATGSSEWALSTTPRGGREGRYEYDDGPRYADGNPYAVVSTPPVGHYDRR